MPDVDKGYFNFDDAPHGDLNLDEIFSSNNDPVAGQVANVTADTGSPTDQTGSEPFLKTPTGTVYNTADDAVTGIAHKDELISQLRQQLLQATHVDPLKKKAEVVDDPSLVTYYDRPEKYFEDLKQAKTESEVLKVQAKFVNEQLAPYAPIIASVVKSQAIDQVVSEIPKFREFLGSQDYKSTLDNFPLLKQSIEISEAFPERSGDLPQLYRMAFDASAGRNLPRVVQSGMITAPVVQTRPTVSSTPSTPPPHNGNVAPPSLGTPDGRKTIIQQLESRGVDNVRF